MVHVLPGARRLNDFAWGWQTLILYGYTYKVIQPMSADVIEPQPIRLVLDDEQLEAMERLIEQLPLGFLPCHCAEARTMLGWSVEALAFRSGVSPRATRSIENGAELPLTSSGALSVSWWERAQPGTGAHRAYLTSHRDVRGK